MAGLVSIARKGVQPSQILPLGPRSRHPFHYTLWWLLTERPSASLGGWLARKALLGASSLLGRGRGG